MRHVAKRYTLLVFATLLFMTDEASAAEPVGVVVHVQGEGRIRIEVASGNALPCDSSGNRRLYEGWIGGGETFNASTSDECVCVRHTTKRFPASGWSTPGFVCRPKVCRGRICRPAPDPTIRVTLSTD